MRKKFLNIAVPVALIANLLFSQVAINLLHDPHDYHQPVTELQKKGAITVQKHGEHCKICSLDMLFSFLNNPQPDFEFPAPETDHIIYAYVHAGQSLISFSQNRAPPLV